MIQFEKRLQVTTLRVVSERIQNDIEAKKNAKTQAKLSIEEEEKWRVAEKIRKRAEEQAKRHEQKRLPKSRGVLKGKKNDNRS
jgi:Flp pilus assembly CpaE family ATPase